MKRDAAPSSGRLWVIAQSLLIAAVIVVAPLESGQWPKLLSLSLGSAAMLYAAWAGLAGVFRLGHNRTPFPAPRPEGTLVTTGIYGLIRHPLYAAMMAIGLGWAFFWSSGIGLILASIFTAFLHAKARLEEALLVERFESYRTYAAQVPRYIPAAWGASKRKAN